MAALPLAVLGTGLVTSVGLTAPSTCAAVRAHLTNPRETRFMNAAGEWILGHCVPLDTARQRGSRLAALAVRAIEEALGEVARPDWSALPLLLCVAESGRPGRPPQLDAALLEEIRARFDTRFAPGSAVIPHGKVAVAVAMLHARRLLQDASIPFVLIAATDSLLTTATLAAYEEQGRLLGTGNSNGFMPGEGAGALLVGRSTGAGLLCRGLGFATETAHIETEEPLRGEGLAAAFRAALSDSGYQMGDMDFRITDISGEHYYFKEADLAVARTLRVIKDQFDLWHPAECIGEAGAVVGVAAIAVAEAALRKGYAPGSRVLLHLANDDGRRAAAVLTGGEG